MSMSEEDIAATVVAWLEDGWDVYQEVPWLDCVADIVAVQKDSPKLAWVIEAKKSLSLAVLAQTWNWIRHGVAHRVSVAVPQARRRNWTQRAFAERTATEFGIGVLYVVGKDRVIESVGPTFTRRLARDIRPCLQPEHKTHAKAGSSRGGHWTAFRSTCEAAARSVRENPGCTGRELVNSIKHHYASSASARSSLLTWARQDKVAGVRVDDSTRPARFYPIHE